MNGTKVQRGMRVRVGRRTNDTPTTVWTVLDRHPERGHWWLHRRDDAGNWVTDYASYTELTQVLR